MGKIVGWVAGIVAGIIVGCGVYYFTVPSPTIFEGMVYSADSPVPKAMVSLQLTGSGVNQGVVHNVTDENGSYRFDFSGLPRTAGATLRAVAVGFQGSEPRLLSRPLSSNNHLDFPLKPLAAAPAYRPSPVITHIPPYVRKKADQATQIRLP